jgi:hypothetical protein
MWAYRGARAALLLSLSLLSGCSAAGSLFSTGPEPAQSVEAVPPDQGCAGIASQRADDAVIAGYAARGSADEKDVYNATYRDCVAWQKRR